MPGYVSLDANRHSQLRVHRGAGYGFAAKNHLVSVVLHEFPRTCLHYPIVFVKSQDGSQYRPMAMLSLKPSNNAFLDAQGQWKEGHYVPAAFRRHPFALASGSDGQYTVCIDMESPLVSRQDGERLFDEKGTPSPVLLKVRDFLSELAQSEAMAEKFSSRLVELDLLVPAGLHVRHPEGIRRYDGGFVVDENRLARLGESQFLTLREHGFISAVYAHLISLQQLSKFEALSSGQA